MVEFHPSGGCVNIYLVPYTWVRHVVVSLTVGAAALVCWWVALCYVVLGSPIAYSMGMLWWQSADAAIYLGSLSFGVAFTSVLCEGTLKRRPMLWRMIYSFVAGFIAIGGTVSFNGLYLLIAPMLTFDEGMAEIVGDPSLVSLRYRMFLWMNMGFWTGFGAFFARRGQGLLERYGWGLDKLEGMDEFVSETPVQPLPSWGEFFGDLAYHLLGSATACLAAMAVWHSLGYYTWSPGNLYYATAGASLVFGVFFGLLVWPIPDSLYAGWVRVLTAERYGTRIPIDRPAGGPSERFIGHFPRGLDLYLPAEAGVAEVHASFVTDGESHYTVRGLSIQPTIVKRLLEQVDLRYDPHRPAPLQTTLNHGDRVILTDGTNETIVEFIMLPKEEM
jgi:hypothetical protein